MTKNTQHIQAETLLTGSGESGIAPAIQTYFQTDK